jgi:hypothetical protein
MSRGGATSLALNSTHHHQHIPAIGAYGTAQPDQGAGAPSRGPRPDPAVAALVERSVKEAFLNISQGALHPQAALSAVAARLVAALSPEQASCCMMWAWIALDSML